MKKFFILLVIIGFLFGCAKKEEKPVIKPSIEVIKSTLEYDEKIKLYDLIKISNGKLITKNDDINTDKLGIQKQIIKYKDSNNKTYQQEINLEVKDTTPPLLLNRTKPCIFVVIFKFSIQNITGTPFALFVISILSKSVLLHF